MQIRALTKLGRQKALLESVQKLLDLNMSLPGQPDLRAGMLALKVVLLKSLGRHDKEIFAAAWALMTEIEPGKTPNQRRAVARAMVTIGRIKLSLGQPEQALIALQGAVGRSDDDVNDDESRDVLAEAYVGIGMVLEQQGRIEDALAAYDQALSIPAPSDYASTDTYAEAARRKAELTARASTGGDEGKSP
jgi:tetratricopeptide (TPR) repeat protein